MTLGTGPSRLCSACGTIAETEKPFCPECGTTYGQPGGGRSSSLSIAAFVCAAISVLFFPIVFGPVAIVLAAVAMSRGEPLGTLALGLSIPAMLLGFLIGFLVYA